MFLWNWITLNIQLTTVWETFEAYLRSQIILYSAYGRKKHRQLSEKFSQCITEADHLYADSQTAELYEKKVFLKMGFDNLSIKQTEQLFLNQNRHFMNMQKKLKNIKLTILYGPQPLTLFLKFGQQQG